MFARFLELASGGNTSNASVTIDDGKTLDVEDDDVVEEEVVDERPPPLPPMAMPSGLSLPEGDEPLLTAPTPETPLMDANVEGATLGQRIESLDAPLRAPALALVRFLTREGIHVQGHEGQPREATAKVERSAVSTPPTFEVLADEVVGTPDILLEDAEPAAASATNAIVAKASPIVAASNPIVTASNPIVTTANPITTKSTVIAVDDRGPVSEASATTTEGDARPGEVDATTGEARFDDDVSAPSSSDPWAAETEERPRSEPSVDATSEGTSEPLRTAGAATVSVTAPAVEASPVPADGSAAASAHVVSRPDFEAPPPAQVAQAVSEARRLMDEAREIARRHTPSTVRRLSIDLPVERGAPVRLTITPDHEGQHRIALVASTHAARAELERHRDQIERILESFPLEVKGLRIDARHEAREEAGRQQRGAR